jgi:hypothetical protein
MRKIISVIILVLTGLVVLAGYFFQPLLSSVAGLFTDWAILLIGISGILGIGYLIRMHILRVAKKKKGSIYSILLMAVFLFTVAIGFAFSPQNEFFKDLILNVQIPIEASLLGVLAISLLYTSLRLIRVQGWTPLSIGFLSSALVMLFLNSGLLKFTPNSVPANISAYIQRLPIVGARGILIGMAIGGLIVGLRVLLAIDRPLGEE